MVVVFTGSGKGKTTASLGAAVRAVGRGQRVLMVQFIKGPWKSGEDFIDVKRKEQGVKGGQLGSFTIKKMGLGFVGILGDKLPREDHERAAKEALVYIREEMPNYDMVIMDEVNVAVSLKLIGVEEVLKLLEGVEDTKIVLLTGRGAPQEFIDAADLATEMREVKHPYNSGNLAKINLDF